MSNQLNDKIDYLWANYVKENKDNWNKYLSTPDTIPFSLQDVPYWISHQVTYVAFVTSLIAASICALLGLYEIAPTISITMTKVFFVGFFVSALIMEGVERPFNISLDLNTAKFHVTHTINPRILSASTLLNETNHIDIEDVKSKVNQVVYSQKKIKNKQLSRLDKNLYLLAKTTLEEEPEVIEPETRPLLKEAHKELEEIGIKDY